MKTELTTDAKALHRSLLFFPEDDTPRLMYADEIEDTDPDRAEFIRVQCSLAACGPERVIVGRKVRLVRL